MKSYLIFISFKAPDDIAALKFAQRIRYALDDENVISLEQTSNPENFCLALDDIGENDLPPETLQ